ncbi:stage II sporulation protein D [Pseudoneobacillus sp. C159]
MKNFKPLFVLAAVLFAITLLIPALLVLPFSDDRLGGKLGENLSKASGPEAVPVDARQLDDSAVEVAVYRMAAKKMEEIPLERYVVGVVAAEMPAQFELEALKAQALTARTYIIRQMLSGERLGVPEGAMVTDTVTHQVYRNEDDLRKIWKPEEFAWKLQKVQEAVLATKGQILTYKGEPISSTFFSTSNGFTENSEDYWSNSFPYLRSVASPWDVKESPKFNNQVVMPIAEFERRLGIRLAGSSDVIGEITERTEGNRVAKVKIGGKTLTGKDVREKLDLKSSDFSWVKKGDHIVIKTKGYGHGVGMSQYGANGMAKEGKTYDQIVKYYYKGINISKAEEHLNTVTAKK